MGLPTKAVQTGIRSIQPTSIDGEYEWVLDVTLFHPPDWSGSNTIQVVVKLNWDDNISIQRQKKTAAIITEARNWNSDLIPQDIRLISYESGVP